jgi:DNA-binding transcriptional MerR regulator
MSNRQTQIALDFGPEHVAPPTPAGVETESVSQPPVRQYIEAAGVVVRIKSYKNTSPPAKNTMPLTPEAEPLVAGQEPVADLEPVAASAPLPEPEPIPAPVPPRTDQRRAPAKPAAPKTGPSKRGRKSLKQVGAEADLIEIPADEVLFSKQYYTMGEVSEMFRVNQSLLRFWETEFDILQPRKNKKGDRYFRPVDIKNLHLIYHLLRQKKYTIEGAKEFLKKNKKADERFEVIQRLREIRTFLLEWKAQL